MYKKYKRGCLFEARVLSTRVRATERVSQCFVTCLALFFCGSIVVCIYIRQRIVVRNSVTHGRTDADNDIDMTVHTDTDSEIDMYRNIERQIH